MITPEIQAKMQAAKKAKQEEKFITKEEFNSKFEGLENLLKQLVSTPPKEKEKEEDLKNREINEAKPNQTPVSPVWEDKAKEILGDFLDHCEVFYPKEGGTHFTVVIKKELSNAPKDYIERMKQDRRTREVSRDGLEGVIRWCTLVKQNLIRNK